MSDTINSLIKFLSENWTIIAGIAATIAYVTEKLISYFKENKKKKESYHKVFTGTIKLYFSYQKHKMLYQEETFMGFPDEIYMVIVKYLDTFNHDIENFKKIIEEETDIIPEISLTTYAMFDIIDRFRVVDRISSSGQPNTDITDSEKLTIRRAHFFALEEFMNDFFKDVIEEIRKETLVSKKFTNRLFYLDSEDYQQETFQEQMNIMKRYYESLHRQGELSEEVYQALLEQMSLPKIE